MTERVVSHPSCCALLGLRVVAEEISRRRYEQVRTRSVCTVSVSLLAYRWLLQVVLIVCPK